MRQKLTVVVLALACLTTLSLAAAPAASQAGVEQPEQAAPAAPALESETPAPPAELDELLDDGRKEMACNPSSCDRYCKQHYGPGSFGTCVGGVCICAI